MALTVNTTFAPRPSYFAQETQPAAETRPFSYLSRRVNPRVPRVIRKQPCVDSEIYFSTPNVSNMELIERPPPRPPRSPKLSRMLPQRPPRTPPRSPLAGRSLLKYTQSETDLHSHVNVRLPVPNTPPPRSPSGAHGSKQIFFPSENGDNPRSPRVPPRSYHAPDLTPAVPPRSPRLPPKPLKQSHISLPAHQPLTGRSFSNRSDRSERCQSSDPRTDFPKMTRQTSADTVRLVPQQCEREQTPVLRSAPPPPMPARVSAITEQPKPSAHERVPEEDVEDGMSDRERSSKSKKRSGDREVFEIEKPDEEKEKRGCCHQCARFCVNDGVEFFIELCLD